LIKQMARQVQEQEKNVRDQCPASVANAVHGRALDMLLAAILPYSSHHPDDILKQSRLVDDVRQRGVKSPISLRPHPTMPGKWMINDGHRRFRAAQAAGLRTIPYFVDVNFDSYD
jgi:ParB family chromosome partitioning protein